jgi:hypothetical protein
MASSIGIKIANGEFYPIMEENSSVKKRLILTTVKDNQPSVQIDLYRSADRTMADAQYIGSLVVEKIKPRPKGEPSIEMVISSNVNGDIAADAVDLDTSSGGEHCSLSVSIRALDETSRGMTYPDFELETNEEPPSGLYSQASKMRNRRSGKFSKWIIIILIILLLLGLCAWWLFFMGGKDIVCSGLNKLQARASALTSKSEAPQEPEPVKQPEPVKAEPAPEPVKPPEPAPVKQPEPEPVKPPEPVKVEPAPAPPPVITAPAEPPAPKPQVTRKRPPPPVASFKVPATIPKEGFVYRIRYGDTLWDISEAFYRNPRLYPRIAKFNNIRNPNQIISGRRIRIPPKN